MVGIRSYGGYVPRYRLDRMMIYQSMGWVNASNIAHARGEKAVANYDENSVTMAVAAGLDCIGDIDRSELGGVYFGSVSLPYHERQNSGTIAGALNMSNNVRSGDFTGSLKAGTTALIAALEAVAAKGSNNLVVCAADSRLGKMGSAQELIYGDGAAALLVSDQDVIAEYKGSYSLSYDFVDHVRGSLSKFDRSWEDRWIRDVAFDDFIPEVINGLLKKYDLKLDDFSKLVYPCYYVAERRKLDKQFGLPPEKIVDPMMGEIGEMGTAQSLAMLVKALEDAQPGEKILVVGFGNGCDALWFEVTDAIKNLPKKKGISGSLANKAKLDAYTKYLAWRRIVPVEYGMRGEEDICKRWSVEWRNLKTILSMTGSKCKACETPQFPAQRICANPKCNVKDEMEDYCFSTKKGKVFSYTGDNLAASLDPPQLYGNIDFDGGGRFMMNFSDCDIDSVKVGMPVEFSFRVVRYDANRDLTTYFWAAVPMKEV